MYEIFICIVFLMSCAVYSTSTILEAKCNSPLCECSKNTQQFGATEFRVICVGDSTQELTLNEQIFSDEPKPDWTRKVYIRMSNFSSLVVENSFTSRWLAYTSCSFDIWSCSNTTFSSEEPTVAPTNALHHVFAGIGVIRSEINFLSPKFFKGKNDVGLKFVRSKISALKLADLGANDVNYVDVRNSVIGVLEGSKDKTIQLVNSLKNGEAKIKFHNSRIGIITKGGLALSDYKSKKATVDIQNSTIGLLEEKSITVGQKVAFSVHQSNIGYLPPSSIVVKELAKLSLQNNVLGVQMDSLRDIVCYSDSIQISQNFIFPVNVLSECSSTHVNSEVTSDHCSNYTLTDSDFINHSCDKNYVILLSKAIPVPTTSPVTVAFQISPSITTTTTTSLTDNTTLYDSMDSRNVDDEATAEKLDQQLRIPPGLFYLVICLALVMLVIVLVLSALLVWGRMFQRRKPDRKDSDLYEEQPAMYFAPKAPSPLTLLNKDRKMSFDNSNLYENGPARSSGKIIPCEDAYLNME